nr:MAG TPA: hypothetical protein [Caudoviricetes sp.]
MYTYISYTHCGALLVDVAIDYKMWYNYSS